MSNETIAPTVIPAMQTVGFAVPTHDLEGAALTTAQQFHELKKNPGFVNEALIPGTPAYAWVEKMNADVVNGVLQPNAPVFVDPGKWRIPYFHGHPDPDRWTPAQRAGDADLRGWLTATGAERERGNNLAELAAERARFWDGKDWERSADAAERDLRAVYRETYEPRMALAKTFIDGVEAKRPGFKAFLRETNLANDVLFIDSLVSLAVQQNGGF